MGRYAIIYTKDIIQHLDLLNQWDLSGKYLQIDGGEDCKSIKMYQHIVDFLIQNDFEKHDTLVAVGGGAVLDLCGFVAATFKRGMGLIFVPTTLLSMVDASVGGKNGVNHHHIKNVLGTIYFPKESFIDERFLLTLSFESLYEGYVEMVKVAALFQDGFLDTLRFPPTLAMIHRSRAQKQMIVDKDPYEKGVRSLLNFGHTIGHALEGFSNYQISHGMAVHHGMRIEMRLLNFSREQIDRVESKLNLDIKLDKIDLKELIPYMLKDKKNKDQKIGFSNVLEHNNQDFIVFFEQSKLLDALQTVQKDDHLYS